MRNGLVIRKYGGTSLATSGRIRDVADHLARRHREGLPTVAVVSARGSTTDALLASAREFGGAMADRETDQLLATGEVVSAAALSMALATSGVPAISLTGEQAGIATSGRHGSGVIDRISADRVLRALADGSVVVVTGFQGINRSGDLVTLGRGGSDTTAVALGAALSAKCEIYTDVAGVYTADPRVVAQASVIPRISSGVMVEMAFAGARVLYSRAIELATMHRVRLEVRSLLTKGGGTVIDDRPMESSAVVTAVTHDTDVARVLVHCADGGRDLGAELLGLLGEIAVPVDLVARSGPYESEFRMGFTVARTDLEVLRPALTTTVAGLGSTVHIDEDVGKLSLIGTGLLNRPQYTARMLAALRDAGVTTSWISTSQLRTSAVVPLTKTNAGLQAVYQEFASEFAIGKGDEWEERPSGWNDFSTAGAGGS